ncbi:MAG: GNAT family N-acetyltransferase [Xanthobacteraceae bacterium]
MDDIADMCWPSGAPTADGSVDVWSRGQLVQCVRWANAFASERKDRRFYELVEETIHPEFDYRYFVIKDGSGEIRAIQPFFILDQDLLVGASPRIGALTRFVRRLWPRWMLLRTLMVGCVAGEGHLDGDDEAVNGAHARLLASAIVAHARQLKAPLVVLKEFPARYRAALDCFRDHGFARVPSLPMVRLGIEYASFEDYMTSALSKRARRNLREKFRSAARAAPIELEVIGDLTPIIDAVYPLYLQVYERSKLHFEKLTREFFCKLGRVMPDKAKFFVWRQNGRTVAFVACMLQDDAFYAEYLGLDYAVALDLHLYHYAFRDMVSWAIANGYKRLHSSGLNYDPKLHLRYLLDPIDLYVRHTSNVFNAVLKRALPWLEPTRYDRTLRQFANYDELWGNSAAAPKNP